MDLLNTTPLNFELAKILHDIAMHQPPTQNHLTPLHSYRQHAVYIWQGRGGDNYNYTQAQTLGTDVHLKLVMIIMLLSMLNACIISHIYIKNA